MDSEYKKHIKLTDKEQGGDRTYWNLMEEFNIEPSELT